MRHKKYVLQENIKDCAVACLYNIIKYHNGNIGMNKLRNFLNTDKNGTSVFDIVSTSNKLGLKSKAYECELNDICNLQLPVIAHIKVEGKFDHFVIIDKIIDDEIVIFDPIRGYIKYDLEKFDNEWSKIIITFEKTNNLVNEKDEKFLYNIYVHIIKNSFIISIVLILSFITSFLTLLHSLFLSYSYNKKYISYKLLLLFVFICISKTIIDYVKNNKILNYTKTFDYNITKKTYNKILSLPLHYHHTRPVGDIITRINDMSNIKQFIYNISFSFIIDFIYILLICLILFLINKAIFIFLLIMTFIYCLIYLIYRNRIINNSLIVKEKSSTSNTYIIESILGIDTIKNLNIDKEKYNSFKNKYKDLLNNNYKLNKLIINLNIFQDFISNITSIFIVFICIMLYKNNLMTFSYVIAFNTLVVYYFFLFINIISLDDNLIEAKNSYIRLKELYKESSKKFTSKKIKNINKIEINNLNYSYNNYKILNNISFSINKGDLVFIKGPSGSGKSTIFKILTKQLDVSRNMIKLNNIDINDIEYNDILNNICYVSQNEYIFTNTILNNIKLFKEATDMQIKEVIKITGVDEFLKKRNITLDYLLEENGHNLSGGERQRIILARSLLQNKKVLILDETMNELDVTSERKILKKIIEKYNVTLILISHRDNNSDLFKKTIKIGGTR